MPYTQVKDSKEHILFCHNKKGNKKIPEPKNIDPGISLFYPHVVYAALVLEADAAFSFRLVF
jgi:hypothetical protein